MAIITLQQMYDAMKKAGETGNYVRKSTDPRPQGTEGNTLYLWDTKQAYIHDGADWREI